LSDSKKLKGDVSQTVALKLVTGLKGDVSHTVAPRSQVLTPRDRMFTGEVNR